MIDLNIDWQKRLRGRLYVQFRDKPRWIAIADLIARQMQPLWDASVTLFDLWDIDKMAGVNLDRIGKTIGQNRAGEDDVTYRLRLKGRIAANRSTGTPKDIYTVFNAVFDKPGQDITNGPVKAFILRIKKVLTLAEALVCRDFLTDSKEAGARGIFQWQEVDDSLLAKYDTAGQGYDDGRLAGALQA